MEKAVEKREQVKNEDLWVTESGKRRLLDSSKVDISVLFTQSEQYLDLEPHTELDMSLFDPIAV